MWRLYGGQESLTLILKIRSFWARVKNVKIVGARVQNAEMFGVRV